MHDDLLLLGDCGGLPADLVGVHVLRDDVAEEVDVPDGQPEGACPGITDHYLESFPRVGSVRLGLVNQGAKLHFPAHCRWIERNISPNPASKIPPLVIS